MSKSSSTDSFAPRVATEKSNLDELELSWSTLEIASHEEKRNVGKIQQDLLAILEDDSELSSISEWEVVKDTCKVAQIVRMRRKKQIAACIKRVRHLKHVHVAFLVDTTGSMRSHINDVKQQVREICAQIQAKALDDVSRSLASSKVSVAFLGYRDFCDGADQFQVFPFSTNISGFESFVDSIRATGGGDSPENVNGALQMALDTLDWDLLATNALFHIGDAPPHGSEYSDEMSCTVSIEGMKSDEPMEQIFRRLRLKGIDYFFGKVNKSTDKMLELFERAYGRAITSFDVKNPVHITESVTSASTESLVRGMKESMVLSRGPMKVVELVKEPPQWSLLPLVQALLISSKHPKSIRDIREYGELVRSSRKALVKIAPAPFSAGSMRNAFHAREFYRVRGAAGSATRNGEDLTATSDGCLDETEADGIKYISKEMVCKSFKRPGRQEFERFQYAIAIEVQTIASFLGRKFNTLQLDSGANPRYQICYLKSKVLAIVEAGREKCSYYTMEKALSLGESNWIKVINNVGAVLPSAASAKAPDREFCEYLSAFSHWTHVVTQGYLMVTDLQGLKVSKPPTSRADSSERREMILLTDPAIHCIACSRFGSTNLQRPGMELFFESHVCNRFCAALDLPSVQSSG